MDQIEKQSSYIWKGRAKKQSFHVRNNYVCQISVCTRVSSLSVMDLPISITIIWK